ncbi:MAG: hypothetical protein LBV18_01360 [Alistipes sp.]|jgi:predicted Zn-dependent protease|nr:hypothetical protein [Alistipes sp.]
MRKSIFVQLLPAFFALFFVCVAANVTANGSIRVQANASASVPPSSPAAAHSETPDSETQHSEARFLSDPLPEVLRDELDYTFSRLSAAPVAPYYIDFRVTDTRQCKIGASLGVLFADTDSRERIFEPHIRVGTPAFDNFHNGTAQDDYRGSKILLPLDYGDRIENPTAHHDPNAEASDLDKKTIDPQAPDPHAAEASDPHAAVRQTIWREVERDYRRSVASLENARAADRVNAAREDSAPDWSPAPVENHYEVPFTAAEIAFDRADARRRVKAYSAAFLSSPDILTGTATIEQTVGRKYFVSSEGGSVVHNSRSCRLIINASVRTDDGMDLPLSASWFAFSPDGLPSDQTVLTEVRRMVETLTAMASAPVVDPYTGPAILSGEAAGVFFHEIFGHRVEGQRMKSDADGQTFKKMVGQQVLPRGFGVYDDPTLRSYGAEDLHGHYLYDDQGVRARRVDIVEDGVLKEFLMTRTPIDAFASSNGHARAAADRTPVSRQSNLVVESSRPLSDEQLRKALVREAKARGKEFGLFFKKVTGGFTQTGRYTAGSFNVTPLEVYKIYVDGRPDELVRGVDLIGTPLSMFAGIIAAGGDGDEDRRGDGDKFDRATFGGIGIFTGVCGAESGAVAVTAVSPALLVGEVEVQRKAKTAETPPLLPRPDVAPDTDEASGLGEPETTIAQRGLGDHQSLDGLEVADARSCTDDREADDDATIFAAMRSELARNMVRLRPSRHDAVETDGNEVPVVAARAIAESSPFHISLLYSDLRAISVRATLGKVTYSRLEPTRTIGTRVLLGDGRVTSDMSYGGAYNLRPAAIETDRDQIRREVWLSVDHAYKRAAADLARKLAIRRQTVRTPEEETLPDLTPMPIIPPASDRATEHATEQDREQEREEERLEEVARHLSAILTDFPSLYGSQVGVTVYDRTDRTLSAERTGMADTMGSGGAEAGFETTAMKQSAGFETTAVAPASFEETATEQSMRFVAISVSASVRTPEGGEFSDGREFFIPCDPSTPAPNQSSNPQEPPCVITDSVEKELEAWVGDFARELEAWAAAPAIDDFYIGPVLFVDRGAFELFDGNLLAGDGSALLAKRRPETQTSPPSPRRLEVRLGKRVLDRRLSIVNHSSMRRWCDPDSATNSTSTRNFPDAAGIPLMGYYRIDADGVMPPDSTMLVEDGMLRLLLGGRIPTPGHSASTGSNRFSVDMQPYIAPGTLEIRTKGGTTMEGLRADLLRLASEDGLDHAYVVERAAGMVDRVWRIEVSTGEQTLVRGARVVIPTLGALRRVAGVSSERTARNYLAGRVPASMIHPSGVLMEDVEIGVGESVGEKPLPTVNPLMREWAR